MKIRLSLLVVVMFCRVAVAAELDTGTSAFNRLTLAADTAVKITQNTKADYPQLGKYLGEIDTTAKDLAALYLTSLKKKQALNHLPRIYIASLDSDSAALESFAGDTKLSIEQQTKIASDVHEDLGQKREYAADLPGGVFRSTIEVTVETIHADGKPAYGLWVRANAAVDGVTKMAMYPFNSATTPTTRLLPPGYLTLWIEASSGGFVLAQQEILLGSKDQEAIRFPVP
jgi:hypothetical protein